MTLDAETRSGSVTQFDRGAGFLTGLYLMNSWGDPESLLHSYTGALMPGVEPLAWEVLSPLVDDHTGVTTSAVKAFLDLVAPPPEPGLLGVLGGKE